MNFNENALKIMHHLFKQGLTADLLLYVQFTE